MKRKLFSVDTFMNWAIDRFTKNKKTFFLDRTQDGLEIFKLKKGERWYEYVKLPVSDIPEYQNFFNRGIYKGGWREKIVDSDLEAWYGEDSSLNNPPVLQLVTPIRGKNFYILRSDIHDLILLQMFNKRVLKIAE